MFLHCEFWVLCGRPSVFGVLRCCFGGRFIVVWWVYGFGIGGVDLWFGFCVFVILGSLLAFLISGGYGFACGFWVDV